MKKSSVSLAVAVFAVIAVLAISTSASAASIKIHNGSKWEIHHFYLSPTSEKDSWGPDQLGDQVIKTGGTFTLTDIDCGKYDIKVEDEDGDACVIANAKLCDDATMNITDENLLKCQKKSE